MTLSWSRIMTHAWPPVTKGLGLIFMYLIALLLCVNGDLTVYSPNYLWKNLLMFSCLAVAVNLNTPPIKPWHWTIFHRTVTIPAFMVERLILHGAYVPLMLLTSRAESFPWFFPFVSLTLVTAGYFISWPQILSFSREFPLSWSKSLEMKENAFESLRDKTILISTSSLELATRYASWIAKAKPKAVTIQNSEKSSLLQSQLRHDYPAILWTFYPMEQALEGGPFDVVIDGFMDSGKEPHDQETLIRIERLNSYSDLNVPVIITLLQNRPRDDQGNIIVEDYARRLDRKECRVIPIRHYSLIEDTTVLAQTLDQAPEMIKAQFMETLIVRSLNLLGQLQSNPTSVGEAWALTEGIHINLHRLYKKINPRHSFQDKISEILKRLRKEPIKITIPDHLTATNEPFLAQVTQAPLTRKKLDGIIKKISDRSQAQKEETAA